MKTLVIRTGGMGDTVLTLRAAQWLCGAAGAEVDVMAHGEYHPILEYFGFDGPVYENVDFESAYTEPGERLVEALRPYDLVIAVKADSDGSLTNGLRKAARGEVFRVDPLPPKDCGKHCAVFLADEMAKALGMDCPDEIPLLSPVYRCSEHSASHVVIHTGSGSPAKNWPLENFFALAEELSRDGEGGIIFTLGPAEEKFEDRVKEFSRCEKLTVKNRPDARELAGILSSAKVFIGVDSGVTHLAAALGAPTVALFGPTDPDDWAPCGESVEIIKSPDGAMNGICVDEVYAAVKQSLIHATLKTVDEEILAGRV